MMYEVPQAMILAVVFAAFPVVAMAASPDVGAGRAAPLSNEDVWKRMPTTEKGGGQALPSWARSLASSLPKTTAALLELDLAQRTKSPLDPKLRAAMRWVAAHANHCAYAEAYAAFDARRAGLDDGAIAALRDGDHSRWSDSDRAALEFARKMTVASSQVTDDEFAALAKSFGEKKAAAMVLLMAYANFQDRLLTCLGSPVEEGGPTPPVDVAFKPGTLVSHANPPKPPTIPSLPKPTGKDLVNDDPGWAEQSYDALQSKLEKQRSRSTRLRVPSWDEVKAGLPEGVTTHGTRVVWSLVAFGYVPELAAPWENLMWINGEENGRRFDRVFGLSVFWVVTRAIDCPYCMGHCEMNWEVIGMTPAQIAERSRALSGDDWSSFPAAEQRAFAFARKLTRTPGEITQGDVRSLERDFGADPAISLLMYACRCNYMVRVSNGFQLSLERDNVFWDYYGLKPKGASVGPKSSGNPVELLSDDECWKRMPKADVGTGRPLPNWAKAVATHLPRTAAAMLELDLAQRTKSPIDPVLRAKMRWVIARANRCAYSEAYALADLLRAGGSESSVKVLAGDSNQWPEADREPLVFAQLHTLDAPSIPDELFVRLRKRFGDKTVAAMVLLGAYGNFQDRLVLGLNLPIEPDGPMAPVAVKFAPGAFQSAALLPTQKEVPALRTSGETVVKPAPEWSELTYQDLQLRLDRQRSRAPRLPIPKWEEVKKGLPANFATKPTRIVWNLVCSGYVPELAVPWSICTRTLWSESPGDRVFEESLFWVQTRAIRCNYCMGHCEMLLEVAGLDKSGVAERTRKLAGDDWSAFTPAEQRAYDYARKLTKAPWSLTSADYKVLEDDLGPERALATFWWLCRGLYMTRVSDGFQLPLERENVFEDLGKPAPKPETAASNAK